MDENALILVLTAAAWAVALFCISLLVLRARELPVYLPLAALFAILCFSSGGPLVAAFAPRWQAAFYELTVPAYLSVGPALWFYVEGLTVEQRWTFRRDHLRYLAPPAMALVLVIVDISVAEPPLPGTLGRHAYIGIVGALWLAMLGLWLWQSGKIAAAILRRLPDYRRRLGMMLSNHDHKDLRGAEGVMMAVAVVWITALASVILRNVTGVAVLPGWGVALAFVVLAWSLGVWGLRQQPGFAQATPEPVQSEEPAAKYRKSALSDEQARRIAAKLQAAMEADQLYLDPNLSLDRLARHVRVTPNHISQTLNSVVGLSFFDYVNRWRVQAALKAMEDADRSVLDIALDTGFNARSSFYRAFRRETGLTPTDYRRKPPSSGNAPV